MRKMIVAAFAVCLATLSLAGGVSAQSTPATAPTPASPSAERLSDAAIRQILVQRVDVDHMDRGVVVGVIDARGRRVIAHGVSDPADNHPIDGKTLFEIGSVTKAFTGLLLADMVQRGEVKLDDPVVKHLPPGVVLPTRNGKAITLLDLTTHTSGLPRLPGNMAMTDPKNPYADYTEAQLDAFLRSYTLTRDIGASYEYSNLGVGLLGRALAYRAGGDYETVLRRRVLAPLGMADTAITLPPALAARFSVGHSGDLTPTPHWDLPVLAGAGGLRSSADDLLKLLAAELGYVDTPLKTAMAEQLVPRRSAGGKVQVALGWHVAPNGAGEIVNHGGATMGFQSFVGFDRASGLGVVVLSNTASVIGVENLGLHLLAGWPLRQPPRARTAVPIAPAAFDKLAGRYALAPEAIMTIFRDGERMQAQLTGQPPVEIFAESPTAFFAKVVDAQLTFTVDAEGKATALTLHQNGQNTPAPRLADGAAAATPPAPPPPPNVVALSPKALDALTGRYAFAPSFIITITRETARLFAQLTGQPRFEIYPKSETEAVWTVVPASATFTLGPDGKASSVTLHQNGRDLTATRLP
ncbi:serine hydrolase [Caulobacter sp. RL271]|jgi:CubicO group peptidase (beta-lactamase class C family)|uniref:Serine hydrolase n=1 Tax=Caulobacter segnis TaxID=88688 RepID=A0ABY4ZSL0_9CAUL|nr:serine hydrolase [Caulobacter segnis]USQ95675.1 serine hydrolase [Caulobacter segnis]